MTSAAGARDRDDSGTARNARPRDQLGRPLPYGAIGVARQAEGVRRTPTETLQTAQRLLDEGFPFHAHEVFEDAWKLSDPSERAWWKALAQFAVGVTHLARGNRRGAATLLERSSNALSGLPGEAPFSIDVPAICDWSARVVDDLSVDPDGPSDVPAAPRLTTPPAEHEIPAPAGDPACWSASVCADCGHFVEQPEVRACPHCGSARAEPAGWS